MASTVSYNEKLQELFQRMQSFTKIGYWLFDVKENKLFWSDVVYEIHELPKDTIIKLETAIEYYVEEHRDNIKNCIQKAIEDRQAWHEELQIYTPDKKRKWVLAAGQPYYESGELARLEGFFQDIDSRKRSEIEKAKISQKYELAIHGSNVGVWDWYVQESKVIYDDIWCEMLGYKKQELEPNFSTWERLVHPEDLSQSILVINDYMSDKIKNYEVKFRMIHKKGHIVHIYSRGSITERDASGMPYRLTGTHLDITLQEKAKNFLKNQKESLSEMITNFPAAIAMLDKELRYITASKKWYTDYGLIGKNII